MQNTPSIATVAQVPLIVVVDGKTASAAEVLTAALQDNGRASVVGTQSFGKGIVQNVAALQEGTCGVSVTVRDKLHGVAKG